MLLGCSESEFGKSRIFLCLTPAIMESTVSWWNEEAASVPNAEEGSLERNVQSENGCLLYSMLTKGAFGIIVGFLGLLGNSVTCGVFWKDRKSSATAYLLTVLAVVDSLVLLIWGSLKASRVIASYTRDAGFQFSGRI